MLEGVVANIENYDFRRHVGGKLAVLKFTSLIALSTTLRANLHCVAHAEQGRELGFHYGLPSCREDSQLHFGGCMRDCKLPWPGSSVIFAVEKTG